MITAIAIVGALAIILYTIATVMMTIVEMTDWHGTSGGMGLGFFALAIFATGVLLAISLYVLALVSIGGVAIALIGAMALSPVILAPLFGLGLGKCFPIMILGDLALIALFVLALVK